MESYDCKRCGARRGIAGGGDVWTDDDYAAQEFFDSECDYHERGECTPLAAAPQVRNDGKKRWQSRGVPASWHNGLVQPEDQDRLNWHELVSAGPKGDLAKRVKRAEAHAASRTRTAAIIPPVDAQRAWHFQHAPNAKPGRFVLHRTRLTARSGGGIDRAAARARRRDERKAAA